MESEEQKALLVAERKQVEAKTEMWSSLTDLFKKLGRLVDQVGDLVEREKSES